MWGNSLGWGISALIVGVTVGTMVWLSRTIDLISDPTDFSTKSGVVDAISPPAPPPDALPDNAATDSVALYHQAIDLYQQNRTVFDQFAERPSRVDLPTIEPAVELLKKASGKDSLGIFAASPQEAVSYNLNTYLAALKLVGDCAANAGLLNKSSDKDSAIADLQAAFCLGKRMTDERLCYAELGDGLGLMSGAAIEMGEIAKESKDQAKSDAFKHFAASLADYTNQKLQPIQSVISSIDQSVVERNAGDMFSLARNTSIARMWRVESILSLGRIKFNAGRPGDNHGAARILAEMARTETDPVIKTAAIAARDLTIEQYDLLR